MARGPWASFEKKVEERELLPPLTLGGEKFQFPSSPPAILFFKIKQFEKQEGRPMSDTEAVDLLLPHLIDADAHARFLERITTEELPVFIQDLFRAWGWYTDDEESLPNREARRASTKSSTKGSARSKQTSSRTTASTSA